MELYMKQFVTFKVQKDLFQFGFGLSVYGET